MPILAKGAKTLDDNSLMPWGKYKGEKMCNVPADYLLHIWQEGDYNDQVGEYIAANLDDLESEKLR